MDDINAYISSLRENLKGISHSECEDITAEIRRHIEDGLQDPRIGVSERQRLEKIMSELGHPTEMAKGMSKVHRRHRYMRPIMAGGAILIIISVFLPFAAAAFFVGSTIVCVIIYPFQIWWFGCPLMITGVGMLLLSVFHLSRRKASIHTIVGSLVFAVAAIAMPLSIYADGFGPYPFLPMLVGGLILAIGGARTVRRERYSPS